MNRKLRAALLCCVLILTLSACRREDSVTRAIEAIGTVTMDSLEKIENAEYLYAQLAEEEKVAVTNKAVLDSAREEYNRQAALIEDALAQIDAIGAVTIDRISAVTAAREAFDAASAYDTTGQMAAGEQTLLEAEDARQQLIDLADLVADEIEKRYNEGSYSDAEALAEPYAQNLPEGKVKTRITSLLVKALCALAQADYESGRCLPAMQALDRCADYESSCDAEAAAQSRALRERYSAELSDKAPANGTLLERTYNAGRNTFTVTAGSTDTCVKLELVEDPEKYVCFYVEADATAKVNLLNGTYRIKYTTGPLWYDETNMFGPDATYITLDETVELAGYSTATHVYWNSITCILHTGYDDELGARNMAPEDF